MRAKRKKKKLCGSFYDKNPPMNYLCFSEQSEMIMLWLEDLNRPQFKS